MDIKKKCILNTFKSCLTFPVLSNVNPLTNRAVCEVVNGFSLAHNFIYDPTDLYSLGILYFAYCALEMRILFVFRRVCLVVENRLLASSCPSVCRQVSNFLDV